MHNCRQRRAGEKACWCVCVCHACVFCVSATHVGAGELVDETGLADVGVALRGGAQHYVASPSSTGQGVWWWLAVVAGVDHDRAVNSYRDHQCPRVGVNRWQT